MKKLALVLALVSASVLMISCSSKKVDEKVQPVEKPVIQQETVKKTDESKVVVYKDVADVRNLELGASATLQDDTGVGFNYDSKNLMDNDFSTSWCGTKEGVGDKVRFYFNDPVEAKKIGILPGFGRDENIYFKNNRIKELKATFTDEDYKTITKTFNFPDKYQMNFMDLGDVKFRAVEFYIGDVYRVDKNSDTCIAELDFWSDYVKNEDSTAAMNYYKKYKEDEALRPSDIVDKIVFSDQEPDKCNSPRNLKSGPDGYGRYLDKDGSFVFFGLPVYVSAYVNEYGKGGDLVDLKWFSESLDFEAKDGPVHKSWDLAGVEKDVPVVKACDGKLYVHSKSSASNVTGTNLGSNKIEFYSKGKLIGTGNYNITQ